MHPNLCNSRIPSRRRPWQAYPVRNSAEAERSGSGCTHLMCFPHTRGDQDSGLTVEQVRERLERGESLICDD